MKSLFFILSGLYVFFITGCSTNEREKAILDACKETNFYPNSIVFHDSIDSQESKAIVREQITSLDNAIAAIGDSTIVELLCNSTFTTKQELQNILNIPDYAYLRYSLYGTGVTKYALVPYREDLMGPIIIVDEGWESDIEIQLKEIGYKSVMSDLENIQSLSAEELQAKKADALRHIEEQKTAPRSWQDVALLMQKKGCSIIGIFQGTQAYAGTLAIYSKGGIYYIAPCTISNNPIDFEYADRLRKMNSNSYQYNEPGSDMPEKYVISGSQLISYCYNPDMSEWVNMGSYNKVY